MENQQLETLHARNQELKKDLGNAKRLVSKIWDKHPEARGTIEEGTGAWMVFGQDVETSVSAQRVTQRAIEPIGKPSWDSHQWPQIVQDSSGNWFGVREGWTMRIAPSYKGDELWLLREDGEFLSHGECAQGWRTSLEQRPTTKPTPAELNLDDYYCKGCGRIGEIEELSAQDKAKLRKLDGKPKTAPVVLPEPWPTADDLAGAYEDAFKRKPAGQIWWANLVVLVEALHARRALLAGVSAPAALAVERGEVLVTVSGFTGSGKSAIAGEIEIMCRALGLLVEWPDSDSEKHMTHADWIAALEQYKPRVRIVECNVPHSVVKGQDK